MTGAAGSALSGSGATGVYVALVDTSFYTYSAAHQFYSDLAGVGGAVEIGSKTCTNGCFDGADVSFLAIAGTVHYEALVFFVKNAGANTTWHLIAYVDTTPGLPVLSNGGDINFVWASGGIFSF